ncbi:MAG: PAS domain S-box protein [Bacteroidota bacterium]
MSFVATAANLIFAVFVLSKNPSARVNQLWSLTILCLVYWGSAEFLLRIIRDPEITSLIVQYGGIGFCILPAVFFHFTFEFSQQPASSLRWVKIMYGIGITISVLQASGYVTKNVALSWGSTFTPSVLYVPFILWLEVCFVIGLRWCWKKLRAATSKREVTQTLLIILGAAVPLSIGSMTDAFIPLAGIEVFRLAIVATTATVTFVSIGVVKYQLMSLTPETTASVILETMSDLVAVADTNGVLRFTNRAFRKSLGIDGINHRAADFIVQELPSDQPTDLRKILHGESVYRRNDGSTFPVLLAISNIFDKGESIGTMYVATDISSRVETENKLRESEEMFRALSEAAPAAIFVYEQEKFLYVNHATEVITGYSKEELLSMPFSLLIHPDMRELVQKRAEARIQGADVPSRYEIVIQRKNGESRWLDFAGARIDNKGKGVGIGIAFDITEKKAIEKQFLRAQRLESIGTLVGGVAHDLNNILAPVVMGIERLRRMLDHEKVRILDIMEVSARRGVSLVRQVLTFAKGTEHERTGVDPKFLIDELKKIIQETFPKSITVRTVVPPDIDMITGDFTQMHQILLNLCINARDAMPTGGTITIAAENIVERNMVCLTISDTGLGIPDNIKGKIFDPFFTTKSLEKGTGLGLSTVMTIVKSHGGTIDVESTVGKGTTFRIILPASPEDISKHVSEAQPSISQGHGELILIVDDEVSIIELTKETLTMHNYNAVTAINGNDAVEVFKKNPSIACVIMDLNMPVLDGPGAIRRLREINPDVPIIATTGYSPSYHDFKPEEFGVAQLLQKPFRQHMLLNALADALVSKNYQRV